VLMPKTWTSHWGYNDKISPLTYSACHMARRLCRDAITSFEGVDFSKVMTFLIFAANRTLA
jgi:hypothetical protein